MSSASITKQNLETVLKQADEILLVDVREPEEFVDSHIDDAINIPLTDLANSIYQYPSDTKIIFICQSGKRSLQARNFVNSLGYSRAFSLEGGMNDWR